MDTFWTILIGMVTALVAVWVVLVVVMVVAARRYRMPSLVELLRLVPDVVRLIKRLATHRDVPVGVRVRLWLLIVYLVSPVDVIPDFIPVIGYADDAVIVGYALRAVVRRCGTEILTRHWPGTPTGLDTVLRVAQLRREPTGN